ncbi:TLC domain-containing protein [Blyttiomyces helicus]|uniref:TLC domain-containing protein n=1 Tax=Blyttiomyces helicus TaxID=388810 RepID=A0A4P9WFJ8_9FUNG|nr:TLC domain-containing protein [Blyttiomyces helicus]|eukprot:RKO89206.1 TLC domain-containing protein [Blyttiomyces helicus]
MSASPLLPPWFVATPAAYELAKKTDPSLAFPLVVSTWATLFAITYNVAKAARASAAHPLPAPTSAPPSSTSDPVAAPADLARAHAEEWANKFVSTVHALVACYGAVAFFLHDLPLMNEPVDFGFLPSDLRDFFLGTTAGYLVFDLVRLAFYTFVAPIPGANLSGPSMFLHHVIIIVGYVLGVHYQYGTFYMALFLNNEVTTPFLNLRYFLAQRNLKSHFSYKLNEAIFGLSFFLDRVILNALILNHMRSHLPTFWLVMAEKGVPTAVGALLPGLAYAHGGLQLFWFALIVRMFVRKAGKNTAAAAAAAGGVGSPSVVRGPPGTGLNWKASKVLGVQPNAPGKALRTLGMDPVANPKAAAVLGLVNREE